MVTDSILAASTAETVSGNSNCSPKAAQILHHHCCHNTAERSPCNKGAGGVTGSVCVCVKVYYVLCLFFIGFHLIDSHKYQRIRGEFKTVLITLLSSVMQAKHLFCLKLSFFSFFYWHNTFVQTSFKNINKLEPLRLTWQKTHYQMSWRRTNIFRKRFTNEMSLQNIKERKVGCHTKYYQKHLNLFGINLFSK